MNFEVARRLIDIRKQVWKDTKDKMEKFTGQIVIINNPHVGKVQTNLKIISGDIDPIVLTNEFKGTLVYLGCQTNAGAGVEDGMPTAEAELCRRTNYWKPLKRIKASLNYPLEYGNCLYISDVKVHMNDQYEDVEHYSIDIISIILPSPSVITINGEECFDRQSYRDMVIRCLQNVASYCSNTLVFHTFDSMPCADLFRCMKEACLGNVLFLTRKDDRELEEMTALAKKYI